MKNRKAWQQMKNNEKFKKLDHKPINIREGHGEYLIKLVKNLGIAKLPTEIGSYFVDTANTEEEGNQYRYYR